MQEIDEYLDAGINNVQDHSLDFTRLLAMHSQEMDNLIRHADLKAQLILGINAILIAADLNLSVENVRAIFNAGATTEQQLLGVAQAVVLVALFFSLTFALFTIIPRVHKARASKQLYFYGDISSMPEREFIDRFMAMPLEDVKIGVLAQIHAKSFIVQRKFQGVRLSLACLFVAVIGWGVWQTIPILIG